MTVTVCLPATEVISIDAMAAVDTVVWWCRLCDHHGTGRRARDRHHGCWTMLDRTPSAVARRARARIRAGRLRRHARTR